jgi:hypothetical protein
MKPFWRRDGAVGASEVRAAASNMHQWSLLLQAHRNNINSLLRTRQLNEEEEEEEEEEENNHSLQYASWCQAAQRLLLYTLPPPSRHGRQAVDMRSEISSAAMHGCAPAPQSKVDSFCL